jgi:hypothetical protein
LSSWTTKSLRRAPYGAGEVTAVQRRDPEAPFPALHLPAGDRVTIEALARHLVEEHQVGPISRDNWRAILAEAEAKFYEIQRRRFSLRRG